MASQELAFFCTYMAKAKVKIPKFYSQMKPLKVGRSHVKMPKLPKFKTRRMKI